MSLGTANVRGRLSDGMSDTFRSMRIRNFRLFFARQVVSQIGNWITRVALTLLVLKLTDNGIHFTAEGYAALAEGLDTDLAGTASSPLVDPAQKEKFRKLIVEKDELFFHRYRPANETYLRGFRKHEQGQNAVEIGQFEPLVEKKEKEIEVLRRQAVGGTP